MAAKKKAPAKKPTPRTRKASKLDNAPKPVKPGEPAMFMMTAQELDNLTRYVIELSTHQLNGTQYLTVVNAVQAARQRPVTKD